MRLLFAQHGHGVVGGVAGVHNQRQRGLVGRFDVQGETALLPSQVAAAPVVIQSGFAYADYFGVACVREHFRQGKFFGIGVVGMNADGGINLRILFGDGEDFRKTAFAHADGQRLFDLLFGHMGEHFWQAVGKSFEVKMAV